MAKDAIYMPFYFEWADFIDRFCNDDYAELIRAVLAFARGNKYKPNISPEAEVAYLFITSVITRSEAKRKKKCFAQKKEKKVFKQVERTKYSDSAKNTAKSDTFPTEDENFANNSDNSNTNCDKNADLCDASPTDEKKYIPTADEVRNFFKKRNFKTNPDEFYNYYNSNGWHVGQHHMHNWYSCAENWEIRGDRLHLNDGFAQKPEPRPHIEENRYGSFDVHEAFKLALERSYGEGADDDDDDDE